MTIGGQGRDEFASQGSKTHVTVSIEDCTLYTDVSDTTVSFETISTGGFYER